MLFPEEFSVAKKDDEWFTINVAIEAGASL
jgi:hypothetical protein